MILAEAFNPSWIADPSTNNGSLLVLPGDMESGVFAFCGLLALVVLYVLYKLRSSARAVGTFGEGYCYARHPLPNGSVSFVLTYNDIPWIPSEVGRIYDLSLSGMLTVLVQGGQELKYPLYGLAHQHISEEARQEFFAILKQYCTDELVYYRVHKPGFGRGKIEVFNDEGISLNSVFVAGGRVLADRKSPLSGLLPDGAPH